MKTLSERGSEGVFHGATTSSRRSTGSRRSASLSVGDVTTILPLSRENPAATRDRRFAAAWAARAVRVKATPLGTART